MNENDKRIAYDTIKNIRTFLDNINLDNLDYEMIKAIERMESIAECYKEYHKVPKLNFNM